MNSEVLKNLPGFKISNFSLWSPGAQTREEWYAHKESLEQALNGDGELPSINFLPIALRKKLSPLTKVSSYLLNDLILNSGVDASMSILVFSTRFGEAENTMQLLRAIKEHEPTSPMAFSRSVHNSPLGIFSIAKNNKTLSSTVSGREKTVTGGLVESVMQLYSGPDVKHVLYVHADERMPDEYRQFQTSPEKPFGFSCLLEKSDSKLEICFREGKDEAVEFLRYLIST